MPQREQTRANASKQQALTSYTWCLVITPSDQLAIARVEQALWACFATATGLDANDPLLLARDSQRAAALRICEQLDL
ncbi:MAG TPA: hypothetical protein VMF69_20590 [Gemmataceae bacterium]|nr:hypothetical protein [Gemmataceae bacterium]